MNSKRKRTAIRTAAAVLLMTQSLIFASAAQGAGANQSTVNPFTQVKGLDYEERSKLYEAMKLSPAGWQAGMVLSKEPYTVVTKVDTQGANVRIWTGAIARELNNLQVFWDEIRVETSGRLDYRVTDEIEAIKSYFESPSQESYRTKSYLGKVPWANIPTDAEAALEGNSIVSADGTLNVYGIVYKDPNTVQSPSLGPVKPESDIPDIVPTLKKFRATAVDKPPIDTEAHWAKEDILDLMKKSIIEGYEDHTIRPDRTLSKAEFVTLLVKSLGFDTAKSGVSGYADLGQHWSGPIIATAQANGLLDRNPNQLNFAPDAAISRMEMVELISRILYKYGINLKAEALSFIDTGSLTDANKSSLLAVVNAGIVGGYPDGSFKPQGSLTRAEAFKVVSKVIQLL